MCETPSRKRGRFCYQPISYCHFPGVAIQGAETGYARMAHWRIKATLDFAWNHPLTAFRKPPEGQRSYQRSFSGAGPFLWLGQNPRSYLRGFRLFCGSACVARSTVMPEPSAKRQPPPLPPLQGLWRFSWRFSLGWPLFVRNPRKPPPPFFYGHGKTPRLFVRISAKRLPSHRGPLRVRCDPSNPFFGSHRVRPPAPLARL